MMNGHPMFTTLPSGRLVRWIRTREDEAGGTVAEFVMVEIGRAHV